MIDPTIAGSYPCRSGGGGCRNTRPIMADICETRQNKTKNKKRYQLFFFFLNEPRKLA
jgi:hypothetical protein